MQVGMSVWNRSMPAESEQAQSAGKKTEPKLKVTTYNFIINPFNTPSIEPRVIKFENSLMYECNQTFTKDWNKIIKRGLPYLDPPDYVKMINIKN